ncbi:MAG TPA: DJ-1/PfpI family protein [Paludibacteraceae bacterium]|nr:DJ-1/PfpI family protein [Paludibacteraceae bacterium]
MLKVFVILAPGFEEIEALAPADVLKRAGYETVLVSIASELSVTGSHGITVKADTLFKDADFSDALMLVLPGGMPGTKNLAEYEPLTKLVCEFAQEEKFLAAICAAPSILGKLGLLNGHAATCFPGYEDCLEGADVKTDNVVVSGKFITARGAGVSIEFGLRLLEALLGRSQAENMANKMIFTYPF